MAHTYVQLLTHIVFSTKYRQPSLDAELKRRLFAYMGGILRSNDAIPILVNGPSDHVHILAFTPAAKALSNLLRELKSVSSGWVHETYPERKRFRWQTGYGAFSVSRGDLDRVRAYIANQEEHHRKKSFQEEYREMLVEEGIEFDERYLWD